MQLQTSAVLLAATMACTGLPSTVALLPPATKSYTSALFAQSENSKRTANNRGGRGGYSDYPGGGQEYDYSGGNLKYGTGKYTQRENDGYQGGVNISKNGRSMQDSVYREDRQNVERARGRPREYSRMDELDDLERGIGYRGEGRAMRNNHRRNNNDGIYDIDEYGAGARDRMGGGGSLLRDLQNAGGRNRDGYDDFGSRGGNSMTSGGNSKVMGGSSHGRGGGYRSSQFQAGLSNERRRYEEYGFRMGDYDDDDYMHESGRSRMNNGRGSRNMSSNFDRRREGGGYDDDYYHDDYGQNYQESFRQPQGSRGMRSRFGGRNGGRGGRYYDDYDSYGRDGYYDDYGDDYGRGNGGLLRDMRR